MGDSHCKPSWSKSAWKLFNSRETNTGGVIAVVARFSAEESGQIPDQAAVAALKAPFIEFFMTSEVSSTGRTECRWKMGVSKILQTVLQTAL